MIDDDSRRGVDDGDDLICGVADDGDQVCRGSGEDRGERCRKDRNLRIFSGSDADEEEGERSEEEDDPQVKRDRIGLNDIDCLSNIGGGCR